MERAVEGLKLSLGDKAPYFSLRGTDNRIHDLYEFVDAPVFVVIFTCNHCPYAQAYEKRLVALAKEFGPKGVKFVAICSNDPRGYPEDTFEHMVEKSAALGFPFPYLQDETQITAQAYDAQCTPECYVFDSKQALRYHGAVDDHHQDERRVKHHYLRDAIDAALLGQNPASPLTPVIGCSIKWRG